MPCEIIYSYGSLDISKTGQLTHPLPLQLVIALFVSLSIADNSVTLQISKVLSTMVANSSNTDTELTTMYVHIPVLHESVTHKPHAQTLA